MVTLAPAAAAQIARPWLQKANAPFTGSFPGACSQYPDALTQVLSSSIRTDPGPATLSGRLPPESVTVQLVTAISHSVAWYAWLFGKAGAIVHQTLSTLFQPSAVKSMWTCQETLSEDPPDRFQLLAVKYRRLGVLTYLNQAQNALDGQTETLRLQQWAISVTAEDYATAAVRGFGLSGFQYLRMFFGAQTAKPDVHVRRFVSEALGRAIGDAVAFTLLEMAAKRLGSLLLALDNEIWALRAQSGELT
jgi:hypothetical protein